MTDFNPQDTETWSGTLKTFANRLVDVERRTAQETLGISVVHVAEIESRPEPDGVDMYCLVLSTSQWYVTSPTGFLPPPAPQFPTFEWVTSAPPP